MKENINALDEINKGATMGMDAITYVQDKVEDPNFKEVLNKQYKDYETISEKIKNIYKKYNSEDEPHETNSMNKMMTWSGINMKTMNDHSTSKLAELLLQGTNMGIIEGRRLLNRKSTNDEVHSLVQEYVDMQEKAVEKLKTFL